MNEPVSVEELDATESTKRVSIIIPVFNGELHLARCIDSVLAQTGIPLTELEVLLIDDGSTDRSPEIIDTYSQAHPATVRSLAHPNRGVALTRNRGIEEAHGSYVMFIDQDDWIDSDYCRTYLHAAELSGADVVYGGYRRPDGTGGIDRTEIPSQTYYSRFIVTAAWAKLHTREILKQHGVTFFPSKFGEDAVFTIREIAATPNWHRIDYVGYNWFLNRRSVSATVQRGITAKDTEHLLALMNELLRSGSALRTTYEMRYYLLREIVFYLLFSGRHSRRADFLHLHRVLFRWYHTEVGALSVRELAGPHGETVPARLAILAMVLFDRLRLTGLFARLYCRPPT